MDRLFKTIDSFVVHLREQNPQSDDFPIHFPNGETLTWGSYCLRRQNLPRKTLNIFVSTYFHVFFNSSYIRTAILDALWQGSFIQSPKPVLRNLFARLGEQKLSDWTDWIQRQHFQPNIQATDMDYYTANANNHALIYKSLYKPSVRGSPPFDLIRFLSVWIVCTNEWNPRVWLALFKLKHNMMLHTSDTDYITECIGERERDFFLASTK